MGSEIEKSGPNYFELYAQSFGPTDIVGDLLIFNKFGEYKAGRDKIDVPFGTEVVAHMPTTMVGYVHWVDGRPVPPHHMGLLINGYTPPQRSTLGDHDRSLWDRFDNGDEKDPWQFTNQVIVSDPKTGGLYTFTTNSKTGLNAFGALLKVYGQHVRQAPDEYPVVALRRSSFISPEYGEVRIPVFVPVVRWVNGGPHAALLNGGNAAGSGGAEASAIAAPAEEPVEAEPVAKETAPRRKAPVRI
jgi:hypothetical protein